MTKYYVNYSLIYTAPFYVSFKLYVHFIGGKYIRANDQTLTLPPPEKNLNISSSCHGELISNNPSTRYNCLDFLFLCKNFSKEP